MQTSGPLRVVIAVFNLFVKIRDTKVHFTLFVENTNACLIFVLLVRSKQTNKITDRCAFSSQFFYSGNFRAMHI